MTSPLTRVSLFSSLLWLALNLFSIPAGAVNPPPGSYGGAAITASWDDTVALKSDGTVWAWGRNDYGKLGDGTTTASKIPIPVPGMNSVVAIAAGANHTVALKSDGTVWTWGENLHGQLGDGSQINRYTPAPVPSLSSIAAIAAGSFQTAAIRSDGTVWAWGENEYGQLGDGTTNDSSIPIPVPGLSGVIAISVGWTHTVVLKSDGSVWTWGNNYYGQLGDGTTTNHLNPILVSRLNSIVAIIGSGSFYTVALKSDGTVWAWGKDDTIINSTTPVQIAGLSGVAAIAAGNYHTVALKSDGTVWAWGKNNFGQLGDGTATDRTTPAQVVGLNDIAAIATGQYHSMALKPDGTVWAWGSNTQGQLGDNTSSIRYTPVQVLGPGGNGYLNLLQTTPPPNNSIVLALEEPAPGSVYSGVSNVRGWAVAPAGMQKIELYVDGTPQGNIPLGGRRADVGAAYPTYPGAADSGFAMALNYSNLTAGPHTLTVRAYDATGGARDASAAFTVARFATAFMADPAAVNLDQATLARAGNTITIQNLLAAGSSYDAQLTWRTAAQGFALTQITQAGGGGGCSYTIDPTSKTFNYQGGAGTVTVTTQTGCAWTAASNDNWITVTGLKSGVGPGTVSYLVSANTFEVPRIGTLTIAGQTLTVSQASGDGGGGGH